MAAGRKDISAYQTPPAQMACMHTYMSVTIVLVEYRSTGEFANPARGQLNRESFLCLRSRLKIWPRETGSAVPSRVSAFILGTQAESGAYSLEFSSFPRRRPFIYPVNGRLVSPEFIRSRNSVPMAFTAVMDHFYAPRVSPTNVWYVVDTCDTESMAFSRFAAMTYRCCTELYFTRRLRYGMSTNR